MFVSQVEPPVPTEPTVPAEYPDPGNLLLLLSLIPLLAVISLLLLCLWCYRRVSELCLHSVEIQVFTKPWGAWHVSHPQPHLWAGSHQLWGAHTSKQGTHSVPHPQAYIQPPASCFHLHREVVYGLSQPLGTRDSTPPEARTSPEQSSF